MQNAQANRIMAAAHIAQIVVGVTALVVALYMAKSVFAPTLLALVFGVVLSPLSDFWERLGLPRSLSALISLVLTLLVIVVVVGLALPVVQTIIAAWPTILNEVRSTIQLFQQTLEGLKDAGQRVQEAVGQATESQAGGWSIPSTADALFLAPAALGQTITFVGVLFFFLLTRGEVYAWIAQHISPVDKERETAMRLRLAERQVARYFLTISVVNIGFGLCTTLAMMAIGAPGPVLWGIATALLNFVLYLGPAIVFAGLLLTGLVAFDGAYALVPAATFLSLNMIEAQFVTPTAIGRTMNVNPLLVFLALVFFLWLWGPVGGFVAIPLLLWSLTLMKEITATRDALRREVEAHGK